MELKPDFQTRQETPLLALSRDFTPETRANIPALWEDFWGRDWQLEGNEEQAAYGVSYAVQADGSFSYAACRNISPLPDSLPDDACIVTLSAGRYAVFKNRGPVSEFTQVFDAIFTQWLPNSGESQREGAVFERYPYEDSASPESMNYEIWVPIAD